MRPIYKLIIFCASIILLAAAFSKKPHVEPMPPPPPKQAETSPNSLDLETQVEDLALNSACKRAMFDDKGPPPQGYIRGVSLSYARAVCNPNDTQVITAQKPLGAANVDALAHYGLNPKDAVERLQYVYSLAIGSGARESDWRWYVGRDTLAKESDRKECVEGSGSTCEAGIYQTSYNSRTSHAVLPLLFAKYRSSTHGCYAEAYKGNSRGNESNLKNWGSDANAREFQRLQKHCPGFATEYHAVMLRVRRSHYGPINKKKALIKKECVQMFKDIKTLVDHNNCK